MSFFEGKRILILSVKFFNYENLIRDELTLLGAKVDLFDERPSNSFFSKAIIRLKRNLYQISIDRHFRKIIDLIKDQEYDYFLLIKGETVPSFFLKFLRTNNPGIIFIYYTYDSFKNNPNALEILNSFDRKFTFDRKDSKTYNLNFRPLFFASEYSNMRKEKDKPPLYDLSFVGTAHSDRYNLSQHLNHWCKENGFKMFNFYYSPSKILFRFKKLTDKNFVNFDSKKIAFRSLSHREVIEIYRNSKAILDINHPNQDGLTMRTFEVLGAGRKLITTNENVKFYPFYNTNNILIIDRDHPKITVDFFNNKFQEIDEDICFSMSLRGWLFELFHVDSTIWKIT